MPSSSNPSCRDFNFLLQISDEAASELRANPEQVGQWKIPLRENTDSSFSWGEISVLPSLGHNMASFTKITGQIIPIEYLPGYQMFLLFCTVYMWSRNYSIMVGYCNWCRGEIVRTEWKLCSGCRLLSPEFIGIDITPFLSEERNKETNEILAPARGLNNYQRIKHLTQEVDLGIPIPSILRSKRKGGINNINYDPKEWEKITNYWDRFERIRPGNYFFPDGSKLSISGSCIFHINDQKLSGNLPILDMAEWLSNPLRSDAIRYWDELTLLLDCTLTKLPVLFRDEENWAAWVNDNSWRGMDYPWRTGRGTVHLTCRVPPFLLYIYEKYKSKYYDDRLTEQPSIPELIRENSDVLKLKEYGVLGENWTNIFENCNHPEEYRKKTVPVLIVSNHRFKLFTLKDEKPTTHSIGNDPRDWRILLTWALQPNGERGSELIQGLLMNWEKEESIWQPSKRQIVSAKLLHDEIVKLNGSSSLVPLEYDESTPGLFVKGTSGLYYVLSPTSGMKLKVDVVASPFDVYRAHLVGIDLCIDPIIMDDIPFGDVAVSYLLALGNDEDSRSYIFTLDLFLTSFERTDSMLEDEIFWETVEAKYEELLEDIQWPAIDGQTEAEIEEFEREQLAINLNQEHEYEQEMERRMEEERERLEEQLEAEFQDFCRNMALNGGD